MALTVIREIISSGNKLGVRRILGTNHYLQKAYISSKTSRLGLPEVEKVPPFPYKTKKLNYWRCFWDNPLRRMNENSKVIVVEGNIGAGKTSLAKFLAEELDMQYFPEPTMDMEYINEYGDDLRNYDHLLLDGLKTCDVKTFYTNPKHRNVGHFQLTMYQHRWIQYMDALAHLMNTGQGVILERCVYSDFVFAEAMEKHGYITPGVLGYYNELKRETITELIRPHLVIYLDVPVPTLQERIKKRNIDYEVNSKVLTPEYLSTLEQIYKNKYLKSISEHAELLIYDWKEGDAEVVVEDIERIDFDKFDKYDKKLEDWLPMQERYEMANLRWNFTYWRDSMICCLNHPIRDVPEIFIESDVMKQYREVKSKMRGGKYAAGYNADAGDKGILFKVTEKAYTQEKMEY